jgi:DNA-binding CsgD family transcriptional regulator/tetratricopeptide (TPR) repeat protein
MGTRLAGPGRHGALRGRAEECGLLDGLLADVRRGEGRSLVLRGEAGIGKTALLEYLIESASGMTVLRAVGVESEMELAYAGLHLLCAPLLDGLARLPLPQSEALRVVFGMTAGPPPDRFLVGLGVLSLLSEAAEESPLLCVVDDAQWLDQASALTLAFVARRLLAEPVGIVFAAREPGAELQHISGLEVRGLRNGDARALLGTAVRFILDEPVRERIIAETRGNPLALLELPRGLTASQLALGFGLVDPRALPERIEESFIRRLEALAEDARRLLLLAAAEPVGDPLLLARAAAQLEIEPGATDRVQSEGLLAIGERVIFRHPLVRSAVYRSAAVEERRAVHLALAEMTDRELDPDRRVWHLAAAATGPDEDVASELERSAGRAQARGGVAAAAAFLRRSVALTHEPGRRAGRCLAAAQAHLQAGAFDEALRLLASAEAETLDALGRARVELLRGQIAFASTGGGGEAPALMLLEAARRLEPLDPALARETYLEAWNAAYYAGGFARAGTLLEVSRAARSAPWPSSPSRPADLVLDGLSLLISEGALAAAPKLSQAASAFADGEIPVAEGLRWGWAARLAAVALWDEARWYQILVRQLQSVREAGLLAYLPIYLNSLSMAESSRGHFATAGSLIAEADMIREATGTRIGRLAAVNLEGIRGREAEAFELLETEARSASAAGQGQVTQWCKWASAFLYNGLGRYEQALTAAQNASEEAPELLASRWALAELIEAAARTGQTGLTVGALERLAESTTAGGADWGMGVLAYSRALLTEGEAAEAFYREAIERLRRTALRPWLARAHLLYGEWLRREHRRVDARSQLRTAYEQFTSIGMEAFAERARRELAASGETLRKRTVENRDDLTAQERQVALLARDGMSNSEIGARLFLSQHTVAYHLRKVFAKLAISSRRELAAALPTSESEPVPA